MDFETFTVQAAFECTEFCNFIRGIEVKVTNNGIEIHGCQDFRVWEDTCTGRRQ